MFDWCQVAHDDQGKPRHYTQHYQCTHRPHGGTRQALLRMRGQQVSCERSFCSTHRIFLKLANPNCSKVHPTQFFHSSCERLQDLGQGADPPPLPQQERYHLNRGRGIRKGVFSRRTISSCSDITNTLVGILGETAPVVQISCFIEYTVAPPDKRWF